MTEVTPPVDRLLDLRGEAVLITGASGNIGAGIARRLAQAGAEIFVHYRAGEAAANELVSELAAMGVKATAIGADLRSEDDIANMLGEANGLTAVVNNAAAQPVTALADIDPDDWREVVATNLDSAFLVSKLAAAGMRSRGRGGAIVNIASIEGSDPAAGHAHYCASKAGLLMLTRSLALEFGRDGIRTNAVSPGLIDRDGLASDWPEGVGRWQSKAPLSRLGTPEDVADAVLFLLSPAARWVSGANLLVDGGMSAVSRW